MYQLKLNDLSWTRLKTNGEVPSARSGAISVIYN
jgi:hypothetical protein